MKSKIFILAILLIGGNFNSNIIRVEAQSETKQELKEYAAYVADFYNLDKKKFMDTIQCESNWDVNSDNPRSTAFGLAQFLSGSFKWFAGMYEEDKGIKLSRNIPTDQLRLMGWAFSKGYQNHWVCYK